MAVTKKDCETVTEGVQPVAANIGANAVVPGTGGIIQGGFNYGASSMGIHVLSGASSGTSNCPVLFDVPTPGLAVAFNFYMMFDTGATADTGICLVRGGVSGTPGPVARLQVGVNNVIKIQGQAFGGTTTVVAASTLTLNTWYRYELRLIAATSVTGTCKVSVYPMFGTPAQQTTAIGTFTSTTYNIGTDNITRIDLGVTQSSTPSLGVGFGWLTIDDGQATTEIGPWVNTPVAGSNLGPARDYSRTGAPVLNSTLSSWSKAVKDGSDSSTIQFPASDGATNRQVRFELPKMNTPTAFTPKIRHRLAAGTTGTFQLKMYDTGGTLRKTWTLAPGASYSTDTLTGLSGGEIATFDNWNAVSLELAMI